MINADDVANNFFKNGYDFSNGVDISEDELRKWIKECVNDLIKHFDNDPLLTSDFRSTNSGNSHVMACMYRNNAQYNIFVIVSKKFIEYTDRYLDTNYIFNTP
jgi:uncharacterized protein YdaT